MTLASWENDELLDCVLPPRNPTRSRRTIVLTQTQDFPCKIVEMPVEITIKGSADGEIPSPSNNVVMTTTGLLVTTDQSTPWLVHQWDRDGSLLATYGARGDGPGEFGGYASPQLLLDRADSLFAKDSRGTWTVLAPNLSFVRSFTGLFSSGPAEGAVHLTDDGYFLSTQTVRGEPDRAHYFHVMDRDGGLIRSFGKTPSQLQSQVSGVRRGSAYAGGDTFWTAAPDGARSGIVLEEWTLDGKHLRTLRRDVPWLSDKGYSPIPGDVNESRFPLYGRLNIDESGLIWYEVIVRDRRWRTPEERPEGFDWSEMLGELYDVRLEVIDPDAGEVLASVILDDINTLPFLSGFRGTRNFYRSTLDSLGLNVLEVFEARLVQSPTSGGS